jgi:hypothetical protein
VNSSVLKTACFDYWWATNRGRLFDSSLEEDKRIREAYLKGWEEGWDRAVAKSNDPYPD